YQVYMERVLFPLAGLQETWYGDESRLIPNRARGYKPSENGYLNSDFIDMDYPHAAGALVSTVADLHRWNQALVEGKVISPASLRRAWTPTTLNDGTSTNYGYGWQISTFDGLTVIEHGGGINGFVTHALWVPDKKAYVAVL